MEDPFGSGNVCRSGFRHPCLHQAPPSPAVSLCLNQIYFTICVLWWNYLWKEIRTSCPGPSGYVVTNYESGGSLCPKRFVPTLGNGGVPTGDVADLSDHDANMSAQIQRMLGFYDRFRWFVRIREQGISAFSQYTCFSGNGPLSMRTGQNELSSKR